jgi:flagellar biosynthesis/type III secretory pathway protein FliH
MARRDKTTEELEKQFVRIIEERINQAFQEGWRDGYEAGSKQRRPKAKA